MKKISQEEFEKIIREIIDGKKSESSVVKELKTEARTLNNKIQELSVINPELYAEFIEARPYKPKERKDINIRGLVIRILKTGYTVEQIAEEYQIGVRTISRKITQLKRSDNEEDRGLYELYRSVAEKKSRSKKLTPEEEYRISTLQEEPIKEIDDVERKRQELLQLEKEYQELYMKFGKEEAARRLGYTSNRIYKMLNELYRIEIERNAKERKKQFKDSLKVDNIPSVSKEEISNGEEASKVQTNNVKREDKDREI